MFFTDVLKGLTEEAEKLNYNVFSFDSGESIEKEMKIIDTLKDFDICGGLVITTTKKNRETTKSHVKKLNSLGVPIILIDRDLIFCDFDGIFSCNNMMTLGVINALNEMEIGQDILLLGFDDLEFFTYLGLNISVISRQTSEMGKIAFDLLSKKIMSEEPYATQNIVLKPSVILRGSEKLNNNYKYINKIRWFRCLNHLILFIYLFF